MINIKELIDTNNFYDTIFKNNEVDNKSLFGIPDGGPIYAML